MSRIIFSVIITSCNQIGFIADAIDSVLSARDERVEIIVADDGSTDGSQDLLRRYGSSIRLVCLEVNRGVCVARNCAAALAVGHYLVFLDGDDALMPWALDAYKRIVEVKKPVIILARMEWFRGSLHFPCPGDRPQTINCVEYQQYLSKDRPFWNSASALVVHRDAFQSVRGWPEELFPMEDQDLAIRLGGLGRTVQVLSPPTILHRAHSGNTVNCVPPFLAALRQMLLRERLGQYPGGPSHRFERYGVIGGIIFFWAHRAVRAGLFREAFSLFASGWLMLLAAAFRRFLVILTGRSPSEAIPLPDPTVGG